MDGIAPRLLLPCRINPLLPATKNFSVADVDGEIIGFGQVRALRGGAMELCDVFVDEKNRCDWPQASLHAWDMFTACHCTAAARGGRGEPWEADGGPGMLRRLPVWPCMQFAQSPTPWLHRRYCGVGTRLVLHLLGRVRGHQLYLATPEGTSSFFSKLGFERIGNFDAPL